MASILDNRKGQAGGVTLSCEYGLRSMINQLLMAKGWVYRRILTLDQKIMQAARITESRCLRDQGNYHWRRGQGNNYEASGR